MQTDTRVITEVYKAVTWRNRNVLQSETPNCQPLFIINCTISGTQTTMMTMSLMAKFIMSKLVTEERMRLSLSITYITKKLPTIPTIPMMKNNDDNITIVGMVAAIN